MTASLYTDSQVDTDDDVIFEPARIVRDDRFTNILAVLAYARAAQVFTKREPALARELLAAAIADFLGRAGPPLTRAPAWRRA